MNNQLSDQASDIIKDHYARINKALDDAGNAGIDKRTFSVVVCQRVGAFEDFDTDLIEVYNDAIDRKKPMTLPGVPYG